MKNAIMFTLCLLIFVQCKEEAKEFPVLDLDGSHPTKTLAISDLVTNLRAVRLETTEESLLPAFFNYLAGEKYIITYSRDNIMQFTSQGKFIRILSKKGNGPGEFNNVASLVMDNSEEKLYLSHMGSNELLVFDLASGYPKDEISIPDKAARMVFVNDEEILAFGYPFGDYKRFSVNVNTTEIKDSIKFEEAEEKPMGNRITWISKASDQVYSLFPESDTLYRYADNEFVPELYLLFSNQVDPNKTSTGRSLQFPMNGTNHMLLRTHDVSMEMSNGFVRMKNSGENPRIFYFDKVKQKLFEVSILEDDLMKKDMEYLFDLRQQGDHISIKYTALDIIEHLEANPALESYVSDLFDGYEFNEDDNPVLVMGKVF